MNMGIRYIAVILGAAYTLLRASHVVAETNITPTIVVSAEQIEQTVRRAVDQELRSAVAKEVTEQEDLRFRQIKWFIAIVGLIGLGTFGTLAGYLIEKIVEARIERRTDRITQSLAFSRFYTIALKLDIADSFSQPDVDAIMNYLRKVESNSDIRHSPEFRASLLQVARSFASAGKSASINELFQIYEREILAAPHLVQPLLHHYGQEIVAREVTPSDDVGLATFEKLERVAASSRVPELALAYRTLYESKRGGQVTSFIRRSTRLNAQDRERYLWEMLVRTLEANWVRQPTPESTEIERVSRALFASNAQDFDSLYGLEAATAHTVSTQGVNEATARQIAHQMAQHVSGA